MTLDLTEQVKELHHEKGISEDLTIKTIEQALRKAYERYYGTTENLEIRYDDEFVLSMYSIKEVVEKDADVLFEIDLADAKKINKEAEVGDSMKIPCNPEDFGRIAIHSAKQIIVQKLKRFKKYSLF